MVVRERQGKVGNGNGELGERKSIMARCFALKGMKAETC